RCARAAATLALRVRDGLRRDGARQESAQGLRALCLRHSQFIPTFRLFSFVYESSCLNNLNYLNVLNCSSRSNRSMRLLVLAERCSSHSDENTSHNCRLASRLSRFPARRPSPAPSAYLNSATHSPHKQSRCPTSIYHNQYNHTGEYPPGHTENPNRYTP